MSNAESREILFYRATGDYGFLSNLYCCPVFFEERMFGSAEEAYQFGKPKLAAVAEWLVSSPSPHLCAAAAHALFVFDVRPDWSAIKVDRMRAVIAAKFAQNADLASLLMKTGDARLVEDSKVDAFWGRGKKGTGKNMLGELLMELRGRLHRVATCIGCGCDDNHACGEGCYWLRVDRVGGTGVCSACDHLVRAWDSGDTRTACAAGGVSIEAR